jgi:hypothetical protein
MLDDERPRRGIFVAHSIEPARAVFLFGDDDALARNEAGVAAGRLIFARIHHHPEIGAVGDEPLLGWLQRIDEPFAGKRVRVNHRQRAAVEREAACVGEPDRAQRPAAAGCAIPDRNAFGAHTGVENRDHR